MRPREQTPWCAEPLARFARASRVRMALVLERSGRVLAQYGFTRRTDVMAASTLAAGIFAAAGELGRQLAGAPFGPLHHAGSQRQVFLAPVVGRNAPLLLLAVFDETTSLGIVRYCWEHDAGGFANALPAQDDREPPGLAAEFERELQAGLAAMFGDS